MSDLISRGEAIDVVQKWFDRIKLNGDICIDGLRSLSSVEPERMSEEELNQICAWLITNIFIDSSVMFNDNVRECQTEDGKSIDMTEVIASLFNLLHKEVTGQKFNYMFHWANKVGASVDENMFDDMKAESGDNA